MIPYKHCRNNFLSDSARRHPIGSEQVLIRLRRILTSTIRMVKNNAVALLPVFVCLLQGTDAELFGHPRTCAPTHNLTAVQILNAGKIHPSFIRWDVRDICQKDLPWPFCPKALIEDVLMHGMAMLQS